MNYIKVLLKLTGRSDYFCSQYDECVTAMKSIPPAEIVCRVSPGTKVLFFPWISENRHKSGY